MADQKPPPKLVTIESNQAPDVFASWLQGASRRFGNVHLPFMVERFNHTQNEAANVLVGRLVMPIEGVEDMTRFLIRYLRDQFGVDVTKEPDKPSNKPTLQ